MTNHLRAGMETRPYKKRFAKRTHHQTNGVRLVKEEEQTENEEN